MHVAQGQMNGTKTSVAFVILRETSFFRFFVSRSMFFLLGKYRFHIRMFTLSCQPLFAPLRHFCYIHCELLRFFSLADKQIRDFQGYCVGFCTDGNSMRCHNSYATTTCAVSTVWNEAKQNEKNNKLTHKSPFILSSVNLNSASVIALILNQLNCNTNQNMCDWFLTGK